MYVLHNDENIKYRENIDGSKIRNFDGNIQKYKKRKYHGYIVDNIDIFILGFAKEVNQD